MKQWLQNFKLNFLISAIVYIVIGALIFLYPATVTTLICYIFGAALCAMGLVRLLSYAFTRPEESGMEPTLVTGIIAVVAGIFVFMRPEVVAAVLPTVLGVLILVDCLFKLQSAIDMLRMQSSTWWISLLFAVVAGVMGVLILFNPFKTNEVLLQFIGITALVTGVLDIISLIFLSLRIHKVRKMAKNPVVVEKIEPREEAPAAPAAPAEHVTVEEIVQDEQTNPELTLDETPPEQ